jgi:amino acid adenylation domain-containing protein
MRDRDAGETSSPKKVPIVSNLIGLDIQVSPFGGFNTGANNKLRPFDALNQTSVDYPSQKRIQDLFEDQVERSPDAVAVIFLDQQFTYRALDLKANQLARFLLARGLHPEDRIGIALERSLAMFVALLAVLKAGGTYVPLDPYYPAGRIKYAVDDAKVSFILTQESVRATVAEFGAPIIAVDTDWPAVAVHQTNPLKLDFSSENLAYVMYTSGSTGRPKGVMVRHRNVINFFTAMDQHLTLEPSGEPDEEGPGVWLAVTSISFDISVLELLWTLARGFRVILQEKISLAAPSQVLEGGSAPKDGYSLPEQIFRHGVTHLQCTPSLARMIVNSPGGPQALGTLQKLLVGGEALPMSLAKELHRAGPKEIWNMYGPTETTVWSTMQKLDRDDEAISIGHPVANTWVQVLGEDRKPAAIGVPGELYIGGAGVARGYLNDPDLTSQRFVEAGSMGYEGLCYRTGDLVRWLPDGRLEFLGRLDHQVKIRGHRVELGEVEAALSKHPDVREAIVAAVDDPHDDKTLVAYLTKRSAGLSAAELRRFLQPHLPAHMVPGAFVFLDAFPLTPNGKVDRGALPTVWSASTHITVSPADEIEARLADLWCYALGLSSIDVDADYFDLGGHSLMAVRLLCEINREFKTELPLGTLLDAPTIRKMVETIRSVGVRGVGSPVVPIQRTGSKSPLFCIGPLNGEVLLFRNLALELGQDQPMFGLQPFGLNRSATALLQVEDIASYYIEQIDAMQSGPYALLGYSFGGVVAVEMAQQLSARAGFVPLVVLIDAEYPAGCKVAESARERLSRYGYHLRKLVFGPDRFGHIIDRLKDRFVRNAYRTAAVVGKALPQPSKDIFGRQEMAGHNYRAKPYSRRVYLLKAESANRQFFSGGAELGWKGILTDLVIYMMPGDHNTIYTGNNLKILAQKLASWLE